MANKIAYVVSRFPALYETFILREILSVQERGYDVTIYSLKNPKWKITHDEASFLMNKTRYSPYLFSYKLLISQIYYIFKKPTIYFSLIYYIIIHVFPDIRTLIKSLIIFPKSVHYAKLIKQSETTHIHAHWATMPTLSALIISRLNAISFSVTAHAVDIFQDTKMLEEKLSKASFIITCTEYNKKYLTENYEKINPQKIYVNYHGINLQKFRRLNSTNHVQLNILSVGRLEESKGYQYLLEACYQIRSKKIPFCCAIIGGGPLKNYLNNLIKKLSLGEHVTLVGILKQEEVIKYYETANLFVLPAISESHWGIPNVIIEAMSMEIPTVTTQLPAISEVIQHDITGIIVPEKDSKAIADAIIRVSS